MVASQRTGIQVSTTLTEVMDQFHKQGVKIGFVFGRFEFMHPGNLHMLRMAAESCDVLIVGIWRDSALLEAFGRSPLFPEIERSILIGFYKMVAAVIPYAPDELQTLISCIQPDLVFIQEGNPFFLPVNAAYKIKTINNHGDYSYEHILHILRKDCFYYDQDMQMWAYNMQDIGVPTLFAKSLQILLAHLKKNYNMEF
jgi:glycerol-3-phosphate cytidylyltransferase-like family protein